VKIVEIISSVCSCLHSRVTSSLLGQIFSSKHTAFFKVRFTLFCNENICSGPSQLRKSLTPQSWYRQTYIAYRTAVCWKLWNQTEIPASLVCWVTNTPVKILCAYKIISVSGVPRNFVRGTNIDPLQGHHLHFTVQKTAKSHYIWSDSKQSKEWKTMETIFNTGARRYSKEHCLESHQVSPACRSEGSSNVSVKSLAFAGIEVTSFGP
jgi:hypothetical protein